MADVQAIRQRLIEVFKELSDLTKPLCDGEGKGSCRVPRSCCDAMYCKMTEEFAKNFWQTDLPPTGHETLPFMGPGGCVVEPHLRPLCTYHVCSINSLGFLPGDDEMTARYFALRGEAEELMDKLYLSHRS